MTLRMLQAIEMAIDLKDRDRASSAHLRCLLGKSDFMVGSNSGCRCVSNPLLIDEPSVIVLANCSFRVAITATKPNMIGCRDEVR